MFTALSNLWIPQITYIVDITQFSYTTCDIMTHVRTFCIYGLDNLRERNGHQQWEGVKIAHQEFLGINIINTKSQGSQTFSSKFRENNIPGNQIM